MKLAVAMAMMNPDVGFRVHFEKREGGVLKTDYFPDRDEAPFETETKAWEMASKFASNTSADYVNIYVVDKEFRPVTGYQHKVIRKYNPGL